MNTRLPNNLFGLLWHFIKASPIAFFFIHLFWMVWVIEFVVWPQIIRMTVDAIENYHGDRADIWNAVSDIVIIGLVVWLTIELCFRMGGILLAKTLPKFESSIRMNMLNYVSNHSHTFFANNFSGSLANKINDMPRGSSHIVTLTSTLFFPAFVTAISVTAIFSFMYPMFGAVVFAWILIHVGICVAVANKSQALADIHAEARSNLAGRIVDTFVNNITVRIFARRRYEYAYAMHFQQDEMQKHEKSMMYIEKVRILLGIVCFIFMGVLMTYIDLIAFREGYINLADLIFIFQASINVTSIVWWAGGEIPNLFQEIGVCNQALTILEEPHQIVDKDGAQAIKISEGKIAFNNVTFRYERNNNIFKDVNIVISPGEKVGLVGFSGSGKTTFVNLMLRYFDIHQGAILIDGQNIAEITQDSLREQIALIPQEPVLFHRTLIENIRYGDLDASDEEVIEAAKKAHCHEFIIKLKDGYHTNVGERGLKLSGGQRQRIAIARAILKQSHILIMDEATSALDSVTERYIQESIEDMSKGKTTLIIAHRLSTLANMDRILVFKDGYIIEDGPHDELISIKNGHYKRLWEMQTDGFLPEEYDEE
ncbi:MAG: ABC transporter ATP-binding protein [Alphaproteobacteria bacterium]|jgi:ATP-binding cassette subfamily B protein|nr:ABC transporter ATP-binding protein/permease [Candidatus Jidaibacter sp.]